MRILIAITLILFALCSDSYPQGVSAEAQKCYDWANKTILFEEDTETPIEDILEACGEAIRQYPLLTNLYDSRGLALIKYGRKDAAMDDFNKALEAKSSNNYRTLGLRGALHVKNGDYEKALADLNAAIEKDPAFIYALYYRALVYFGTDNAKAKADLKQILKLSPSHFEAKLLLDSIEKKEPPAPAKKPAKKIKKKKTR